MDAVIVELITNFDTLTTTTDKLTADMDRMLERGNRPSITTLTAWSENSAQLIEHLEQADKLTSRLDPAQTAWEDITALKESQDRLMAAQRRHGEAIRRVKKALGLIP